MLVFNNLQGVSSKHQVKLFVTKHLFFNDYGLCVLSKKRPKRFAVFRIANPRQLGSGL
jgi:hypothetical protein